MDLVTQRRITLLSLMGMVSGDLSTRYEQAQALLTLMVTEGWFGGTGKERGPKQTSSTPDSVSPSLKNHDKPATRRQVQRALDLESDLGVEALEAMTQGEIAVHIAFLPLVKAMCGKPRRTGGH